MPADYSKIGQFDRSFIVIMVRDFFLVLMVVVLLELSLRFIIVLYEFNYSQQIKTEQVAQDLAADVVNIMRNRGGPVASSTFYPILKKNFEAIGYEVSLEPSKETLTSIEKVFSFKPIGIPATWSEGNFHEKVIDIRADEFCLSCHVDAELGVVLGSVKVRSYLSHHLKSWWHEVRLTAVLGLGKILFHTIILFFLLKVRMEPMMSLRSVVASLAKAGADLHHRATLTSEDEFSELARDLNHFLDRLCLILDDVGQVLEKINELNLRLTRVNSQIGEKFENIQSLSHQTSKLMSTGNTRLPLLSREWKTSMQLALTALVNLIDDSEKSTKLEARLEQIWQQFDETSLQLEAFHRTHNEVSEGLIDMNTELLDFEHHLTKMGELEGKMESISRQGQKLIKRLTVGTADI